MVWVVEWVVGGDLRNGQIFKYMVMTYTPYAEVLRHSYKILDIFYDRLSEIIRGIDTSRI